MEQHTLTFVAFEGHVEKLKDLTPTIHTISLEEAEVPNDLLTLKDGTYHGVISEIPRDILEPFLSKLDQDSRLDMDAIFENKTTVCMILDTKVLFLDMFANSDCFTDHPLAAIGKAYLVRDKLDLLFPEKKLEYLPQCPKWFEKQATYYKEHKESKQKIETQLELLRILSGKNSSTS